MKHLGGGLSHTEIWNLPISVRHFYLKMVSAEIKEQNKQMEEANKAKKQTPRMPKMPRMPKVPRNIRK